MRTGELNGRAKLTWDVVEQLRQTYRRSRQRYHNESRNHPERNRVSVFKLALDHDVSPGTMYDALVGKTWSKK